MASKLFILVGADQVSVEVEYNARVAAVSSQKYDVVWQGHHSKIQLEDVGDSKTYKSAGTSAYAIIYSRRS